METVFSGTVGGAMTGMMLGVPSIALSQAYNDRNNVLWDASRTLGAAGGARSAGDRLEQGCLPERQLPGVPAAEAGPMTLARQGVGMIAGMHVDTRTDPRGMTYHWLNFRRGDRAAGAGERLRRAARRQDRGDAAALRPHGRGRVSGAGREAAALHRLKSPLQPTRDIDGQSGHVIRIR